MTPEVFTKQAPIVFAAIGQHLLDHGLPVPIDTEVLPAEQTLRIRVAGQAEQQAWLNTLVIEGEHNEPWQGPIWVVTTWKVRLPDLGLGFEIRGLRCMPDAVVRTFLSGLVSA